MKLRSLLLALSLVGAIVVVISCSATSNVNHFGLGGSGNGNDGSGNDGTGNGDTGLGGGFNAGDGGNSGQCSGLQCVAQKDNCAGQGKKPTTITGFVYDPAGALPLYNVFVYIPNTTPDAIAPGDPTCTQCEAPASGSPVIGASTDATGYFTLSQSASDMWGVPSGDNIPLVLQVGKWRRQVVMAHINPCTLNPLPNPPQGSPAKLRLPAKSSEGDMPLMAFTSGCDPAECFLRHIGIDDSEFVPPNSATGHVHFYTGQDAESFTGTDASMVSGGNTSADTYQWWQSSANLLKYDIVFNACECNPNDRGAGAYPAMREYLDGGGRLFTTHYYYNWFAPPTGPTDFQGVVQWTPDNINSGNCSDPTSSAPYCNYYIDQTFPKGMAFAQWLQNANVTQTLGQITLTDTRYDMNQAISPTTDWIYNAPSKGYAGYASMYMSFNTPLSAPTSMQCGRAVFSDVHLSGSSDDSVFPQECLDNPDPDNSHAINEKALEFLFFDLSSCVQNNSMPPPPPPTQ